MHSPMTAIQCRHSYSTDGADWSASSAQSLLTVQQHHVHPFHSTLTLQVCCCCTRFVHTNSACFGTRFCPPFSSMLFVHSIAESVLVVSSKTEQKYQNPVLSCPTPKPSDRCEISIAVFDRGSQYQPQLRVSVEGIADQSALLFPLPKAFFTSSFHSASKGGKAHLVPLPPPLPQPTS